MIRTESIRFKLLRNGIECGELYATGAPSLRMSSDGEIKMSMQGTFLPVAIDKRGNEIEVDWMADEIQPVLNINGTEGPLGILMPAKVTPSRDKNKETINIQCYDRCWRVRDTRVEGTIYFASGTNYISAVESLLTAAGIANVIKTATTATLTEAREDWKTGDSYLTIANQLLEEIGYKQLWFNSAGFAILEPASTPTAENIQHVFTDTKPDPRNPKELSMIRTYPTLTRETDIYEAPNVYVVVCSNADKNSGMLATAENTNPKSPLSIPRRGRRIVQVVDVDNIASQSALQAYADRLIFESMTTGETIKLETALQLGFGVQDVCAVKLDDVLGVCVENSWEMQLQTGGKMTHSLKKVVINLG